MTLEEGKKQSWRLRAAFKIKEGFLKEQKVHISKQEWETDWEKSCAPHSKSFVAKYKSTEIHDLILNDHPLAYRYFGNNNEIVHVFQEGTKMW